MIQESLLGPGNKAMRRRQRRPEQVLAAAGYVEDCAAARDKQPPGAVRPPKKYKPRRE